jgi:hypothetical protein
MLVPLGRCALGRGRLLSIVVGSDGDRFLAGFTVVTEGAAGLLSSPLPSKEMCFFVVVSYSLACLGSEDGWNFGMPKKLDLKTSEREKKKFSVYFMEKNI